MNFSKIPHVKVLGIAGITATLVVNPGASYKSRVAPHELMLINLRENLSEQHNLVDLHPDVLEKMTMLMDSGFNSLGKLPPSITIRTPADQSHYDYLIKKYGNDFYLLDD